MNSKILTSTLSITGLHISFLSDACITSLSLDPKATCELLKEFHAIEDWTADENGEPVILYTDPTSVVGYNGELWCDFVKSFSFIKRVAEIVVENRTIREESAVNQAIIAYLLKPLQAA